MTFYPGDTVWVIDGPLRVDKRVVMFTDEQYGYVSLLGSAAWLKSDSVFATEQEALDEIARRGVLRALAGEHR